MADPREKPPDHQQAELGLSRVTRARLEPTAVSEMMSAKDFISAHDPKNEQLQL